MTLIRNGLIEKGMPLHDVTLGVRVSTDINGRSNTTEQPASRKFELDTSDLHNVLSVYGKITQVVARPELGRVDVTFADAVCAALACLSLNRRWLPRDKAYLLVAFLNS